MARNLRGAGGRERLPAELDEGVRRVPNDRLVALGVRSCAAARAGHARRATRRGGSSRSSEGVRLRLGWRDEDGKEVTERVRIEGRITEVPTSGTMNGLEVDPQVELLFREK